MVTNENVINSDAISFIKMGESNMTWKYRLNRSMLLHKSSPTLYDELETLQKEGFSSSDMGRLYVKFLFEKKPSRILGQLRTLPNAADLEKVRRVIKREIQKDTRIYFSGIMYNVQADQIKPDELVPDLDVGGVQSALGSQFKKSDTIETVVAKLLDDRKKGFERIGNALVEGALRYKQRKEESERAPRFFKLFLEYNRIFEALTTQYYSATQPYEIMPESKPVVPRPKLQQ